MRCRRYRVPYASPHGWAPSQQYLNYLTLCHTHRYPETRAFELTGFKVRVLDSEHGTRSIVRVLIDLTDGERSHVAVVPGTEVDVVERRG